jgi:hypothetical protein
MQGKCIGCYARWVLRFDKKLRLPMIVNNKYFDVEELKQEVIKRRNRYE